MRLASIDIGTNSVHMVIADVTRTGHIRVVDRMKEMVRLGDGVFETGRLAPESCALAERTLGAFRRLAKTKGVTRLRAVATSAVREARDGDRFIARLRRQTGIPVEVISGTEEAHLIYRAVRHASVLEDGPHLLVDVGGGSVELTLTLEAEPTWSLSLPIGVARLSQHFFSHDPPKPIEIDALRAHLEGSLREPMRAVRRARVVRAVGTSGTITTLVRMARAAHGEDVGRLDGASASRRWLMVLGRQLTGLSAAERLLLPGIDPKRNDQLPGASLLLNLMCRWGGLPEVRVCTWALREGLLLDLAGVPTSRTAGSASARHRSVAALARQYAGANAHGEQVARIALDLFDGLAGSLRLSADTRELLEHAALLHDIGHAINHDRHHRHAAYLIRNTALLGFEPVEVEIIAQVARGHRKQAPKTSSKELSSLPEPARETVRGLAALLRVADALDRTHFGVVRSVRVRTTASRVTITVDPGPENIDLELWAVERRAEFLGRLVGLPVVLRARRMHEAG